MDHLALPANIIERMRPADRKALGVQTPEQHAAKAETQSERALQRLCEQELSRRGIEFLHLSPRAREKIGWPDLVFCCAGMPCAVELKSVHGSCTPEQSAVQSRMALNGWAVFIVRDFDSFRKILEMAQQKGPSRP